MSTFQRQLADLQADLVAQSARVYKAILLAVESAFDRDRNKAEQVVAADAEIDRVDVAIERASIPLLLRTKTSDGPSDEHDVRSVLTIVKINNELERMADCAVNVAEVMLEYSADLNQGFPATFRVMANSVIGMVRDANRALAEQNVAVAQQVLLFDDTVDRFKLEIGLDAERKVAAGAFAVSYAFRLRSVVSQLERIADHCTNVCEQVIYLNTGKVVKHLAGGWSDPELPGATSAPSA